MADSPAGPLDSWRRLAAERRPGLDRDGDGTACEK
ncbi:excalibur calcium-binding domain-containing protein [Saccharothrix ecbatanensis]